MGSTLWGILRLECFSSHIMINYLITSYLYFNDSFITFKSTIEFVYKDRTNYDDLRKVSVCDKLSK